MIERDTGKHNVEGGQERWMTPSGSDECVGGGCFGDLSFPFETQRDTGPQGQQFIFR